MAMNNLLSNMVGNQHGVYAAGRIGLFPSFPTHVDTLSISTVNKTWNKPTGCKWVIFSATPGLSFAARKDNAAVYPAGDVTNGTGSLLNPAQMDVSDVTSLGIIGDSVGFVSIACYE